MYYRHNRLISCMTFC